MRQVHSDLSSAYAEKDVNTLRDHNLVDALPGL